MAVIQYRGPYQFRVLIRRQGFPTFTRTFELKRDAETWSAAVEAAIGLRDFAELRRLTATGTELGGTIADVIDRWERDVLPNRGNMRSERPQVRRLRDHLGKLTTTMLSPIDVVNYRDARLAAKAAPGTVRAELNLLSVILSHAISEWGVQGLRNVVRDVRKPALPRGRDRRVSELELQYLLRAARHAPPDRPHETPARGLAPLIVLAVETSMRLGELIGLSWRDVDEKHRTAHLPKTKNGHSRTVALSSNAVAALAELAKVKRIDGKVFDWAASDSVSHPFRRCVERARSLYLADCEAAREKPAATFLRDVRFHDLRHEATSRLFEKGLGVMEVASMTGHRSLAMLARYTHVEARKVAQKLG
jgi:integrase